MGISRLFGGNNIMIISQYNPKDGMVMIRVVGSWDQIMYEYKAVTDHFLKTRFDDFMAAMDKWYEEVNGK